MKISTIIGCLLFVSTGWSQNKLIKVKAGTEAQQGITFNEKYLFPEFKMGDVILMNGSVSRAKLDYNCLLNEMHFIALNGDTLALDNENFINRIVIDSITFYYSPEFGFLEVIQEYRKLKLAQKQTFRVAGIEKMSAYQQSSATGAIKNYSVLSSGNNSMAKLDAKGDIVFSKEKFYYFIDSNNRFYKASKTNLLKLYSSLKQSIQVFIKQESIDFYDENSLKKILQYCDSLQ